MNSINTEELASHKTQNIVHTVLILSAMVAIMVLCGMLIFGSEHLWLIAITVVFLLTVTPHMPIAQTMRLYGAKPLQHRDAPVLYNITSELAQHAQIPALPKLYYIASSAMNAFTVGTPENSAIALTDGLLRRLSQREIAGVLAHEVAHIAHHDIQVMNLADTMSRITSVMASFGILLLLLVLPMWLLGIASISLFAVALLLLAPVAIHLLQASLSRTREYNADLGAAALTGDPLGLAMALQKLEMASLNWMQRLFTPKDNGPSSLRTHPATADRIQRLKQLVATPAQRIPLPFVTRESLLPSRYVVITNPPRRHWSGLWY